MKNGIIGDFNVLKMLFFGSLFDVVIKFKKECNDIYVLNVKYEVERVKCEVENVLFGNEMVIL